jgi:hypothetical protein
MPVTSLPPSPLVVADTRADRRGLPQGSVVVRVVPHVREPFAAQGGPGATPRLPDRNIPAHIGANHGGDRPGTGDPR